jgi:hypothetical protein
VIVAGVAWIIALSTLSSQYQGSLPGWAKARGMAYYLVVFQGGSALGSAAFGIVAEKASLQAGLASAAALLALSGALGSRLHFRAISPKELLPAGDWPEPHSWSGSHPAGPVLVTVEYHAATGRSQDLIDALRAGRYARRRTGAVSWQVWSDVSQEGRVLEQFSVGSWDEHLRQHERVSRRDQQRLEQIQELTDPDRPTTVTHWVVATAPGGSRSARST